MKNSQKYAPPEGYYEQTKSRQPSPFLEEAIKLLSNNQNKALDFGCGAGSETAFILNNGLFVVAVDGNPEAKDYIDNLPNSDRVKFINSDFETFQFGKYDLINSSRSLPFIDKTYFEGVIRRLKCSLNTNGVFVGELYGVNDQWNKSDETMTFVDRNTVNILLKDMDIIKLEENEFNGKIADGRPKHWHTFKFIAKKS